MPDPWGTVRDAVADFCRMMAETTGDPRFNAAAGMLAGQRPGRHPVDDAAALRYAETLLNTCMATSIHRACEMAAKLYAAPHQVPTTRDRLRKKLRTKLNDYGDL